METPELEGRWWRGFIDLNLRPNEYNSQRTLKCQRNRRPKEGGCEAGLGGDFLVESRLCPGTVEASRSSVGIFASFFVFVLVSMGECPDDPKNALTVS
jgi:hypothetical protein